MKLNHCKIIIACAFFLIGFQSCEKSQNLHQEKIETFILTSNSRLGLDQKTNGKSLIITIEDARVFALGYAKNKFNKKSAPINIEIENETIVKNAQNVYCYIFNFKNKLGFLVVAAEGYEKPVLAFSETGNIIKGDANKNLNCGA